MFTSQSDRTQTLKIHDRHKSAQNLALHSREEGDDVPGLSLNSRSISLLDGDFEFLDSFLSEYVSTVPAASDVESDTDRFLEWLQRRVQPNSELAELAFSLSLVRGVEQTALRRKLEYARFVKFMETTEPLLSRLGPSLKATVRLNPIHVWASYQPSSLDRQNDSRPESVLVYRAGKEVRKAILRGDAISVVRHLEQGDVSLRIVFCRFRRLGEGEVVLLLKHLAELRIIAIA